MNLAVVASPMILRNASAALLNRPMSSVSPFQESRPLLVSEGRYSISGLGRGRWRRPGLVLDWLACRVRSTDRIIDHDAQHGTAAERSHLRRSTSAARKIEFTVVQRFTSSARAVTAVPPVARPSPNHGPHQPLLGRYSVGLRLRRGMGDVLVA